MPKGISNFQIKFVIKNFQDDDMMKNFVGIYFQQTIWTNLLISNQWYLKKLAISFLFAKTGSSDKDVTHWWSILSIEAKTDLFFFFFWFAWNWWIKKLYYTRPWISYTKNIIWNWKNDKNRQQNIKYKIFDERVSDFKQKRNW